LTQWLMPGIRSTGYLRGWYEEGGGRIYVNRGVGTINLPLRLFARPEIALFTLRAASRPGGAIEARQLVPAARTGAGPVARFAAPPEQLKTGRWTAR
jgi:hypothetical protein